MAQPTIVHLEQFISRAREGGSLFVTFPPGFVQIYVPKPTMIWSRDKLLMEFRTFTRVWLKSVDQIEQVLNEAKFQPVASDESGTTYEHIDKGDQT